jgi:hypothetical protein
MTNIIQFPRTHTKEYKNERKLELLELHADRRISDGCFKLEMLKIGYFCGIKNAKIIKPKCFTKDKS